MRTLLLFLLVPLYTSLAQVSVNDTIDKPFKAHRAKAIYVEVLGSSGLDYSLNYDMRFKTGRKGWGFRAGITRPAQVGQTEIFSFPLLINKVQSDRRAALEVGAGFVVNYKKLTFEDSNNIIQRRQSVQFPAVANVGVRLQPLRTGVIWRLYWAPSWRIGSSESPYLQWFGTSLGIGFN
jgi:hypothetical protein